MTLSTPAELQARYDALTARIIALDRDIAFATSTEARLVAQEKRDELARERETVAGDMLLLGVTPQHSAPLEHRVTTLEREVNWLKRLVKPGLPGSKVILYGPIERHPAGIVEWMAPCAVETQPFPKDDTTPPTPPTPPVAKYKRPKSMAGLHMEVVGAHTGYGDFLKKCADAGRPVGLVKAFYDGGAHSHPPVPIPPGLPAGP